jgi:hypothetical protein
MKHSKLWNPSVYAQCMLPPSGEACPQAQSSVQLWSFGPGTQGMESQALQARRSALFPVVGSRCFAGCPEGLAAQTSQSARHMQLRGQPVGPQGHDLPSTLGQSLGSRLGSCISSIYVSQNS